MRDLCRFFARICGLETNLEDSSSPGAAQSERSVAIAYDIAGALKRHYAQQQKVPEKNPAHIICRLDPLAAKLSAFGSGGMGANQLLADIGRVYEEGESISHDIVLNYGTYEDICRDREDSGGPRHTHQFTIRMTGDKTTGEITTWLSDTTRTGDKKGANDEEWRAASRDEIIHAMAAFTSRCMDEVKLEALYRHIQHCDRKAPRAGLG